MKKEEVQKHKEAIKWWLNNPDRGVWCNKGIKITHTELIHDWILIYEPKFDVDFNYVQNDEYAEFRKALADGKKIQFFYRGAWRDCYCYAPNHSFEESHTLYRIKQEPKEPEFPCYFREKSSGIVVKFPEKSNRDYYSLNREFGVVVESSTTQAQKTLGFEWRCWDTFSNPDDWEQIHNYQEIAKFNVGDWVIYNNQPEYEFILWNEKSERHYKNNDFKNRYTLWKPKKGEFCVFWNRDIQEYFVTQFQGKVGETYFTKFEDGFRHIAPLEFIQTLKDK